MIAFFKSIWDLFFGSNNDNELSNNHKEEYKNRIEDNYETLSQEKIDLLIAEYNCKDEEELVICLVKKEQVDELTAEEEIVFNDPKWDFLKSFAEMGYAVSSDQYNGRNAAIRELVENNYQYQSDNWRNPLKELTDFTVKYFEKYFAHFPDKAEELMRCNFPTMYPYLKKVILKDPRIIPFNEELNNQEAYDEFIFFIVDYFLVLFPEKEARDKELERNFKYCLGSIKIYIEEEELKRRIS